MALQTGEFLPGVKVYDEHSHNYRPVYASDFVTMSSRQLKKKVDKLGLADRRRLLRMVLSLEPATYLFKWEELSDTQANRPGGRLCKRLGLIAEEVPLELLDESGKGVDLYALTTTVLAAVQQLNLDATAQMEALRAENDALSERLATLEALVNAKLTGP
jgi:hypothetical protein